MNGKKLIAILLACLMCFSVLFSGCAEESGNENANANSGNNEQVSTDVAGKLDSAVSDKIEDVISDVLGRQQPSSKHVVELAEKNELTYDDIKNYKDFLLYVNQNDETIRLIRDELAPGRSKELPLDLIFNIGNSLTTHDIKYYNLGLCNGTSVYFEKYAYYRDAFNFDNGLNVDVFYLKPDMIESAYDFFMKTYYTISCLAESSVDEDVFKIVEYDENILKYNTLLSIKKSVVETKYTVMPLGDEFMLRYNSDGDLDNIYIFINGVVIDVCFYEHGNIPFAEKINNIKSGWLTTLINDKTAAAEAGKALATVLETVNAQTK